MLRRIEALTARQPVVPEHVAHAYAPLGHADAAFRWLDRGVAAMSTGATWYGPYGLHPGFEPLRADPRYELLRQRLRLE